MGRKNKPERMVFLAGTGRKPVPAKNTIRSGRLKTKTFLRHICLHDTAIDKHGGIYYDTSAAILVLP